MTNKTYFQLQDQLYPRKSKLRRIKWRKEHPEKVREATRLRVQRFRARQK